MPPASILIFAGFHSLEPAGASQALPNFQVLSSNLPWLVAPSGALSIAWLSSPALAASGYLFCRAATSSSLAWLKAAPEPRYRAPAPTTASTAADSKKRFMMSPLPLLFVLCGRSGPWRLQPIYVEANQDQPSRSNHWSDY